MPRCGALPVDGLLWLPVVEPRLPPGLPIDPVLPLEPVLPIVEPLEPVLPIVEPVVRLVSFVSFVTFRFDSMNYPP